MASVEELIIKLTADNSNLKNKLAESEKGLGKMGGVANKIGPMIAGAFSVGAVVSFGSQLLQTIGTFQRYNAVLTNTLGSQEKANMAMTMIKDVAATTPFSVDQLTASYVKLANQGFTPTKDEIIKLGDVASSTGKGFDQLAEAIIDATSGQFERLKEFGIKAAVNGDKVTFSFKGVQTQVDNNSDSIRNYIISLGDLEGVSGSMAAISKTLEGQVSNLGDGWDAFLLSLSSSAGPFSIAISTMSTLLQKATMMNDIMFKFGGNRQAYIDSLVIDKGIAEDIEKITGQWKRYSGLVSKTEFNDAAAKRYTEITRQLFYAKTSMSMAVKKGQVDEENGYKRNIAALNGEEAYLKSLSETINKKAEISTNANAKVTTSLEKYISTMEAAYKKSQELEAFDVPVPSFVAAGVTSDTKGITGKGITQSGDGSKLLARGQTEFGSAIKTTNSELETQMANMQQMQSLMAGFGGAAATAFGEQSAAAKAFAIGQVIAQAAVGIMGTWAGYAEFGFAGTALALAQTAMIGGVALTQIGNIAGAFAMGGIVGGSSMSGDNLTARVNSGEMILNGNQQRELFAMAKGMGARNQVEVVGYISGDVIRLANKRSTYVANRRG